MENLAAIIKHRGKIYSLKEIPSIEIKLSDFENKIIEARLQGVSFCQIDDSKIKWHIDQIMLRGAAICGCALPNTEFFADIIGEELLDFILNYGYKELTYQEVLLALRFNAKGGFGLPTGLELEIISFFGNCFNIDYISKVLTNYGKIRTLLDRKLQNVIDGY